jgi:hypothetical protein
MIKVASGLLVAVLATAFAARLAVDAAVHTEAGPANEPWAQNRMELVAWNGEKWTAWVRDDVFEQRPQNEGRWSRHSNASLAFVDWEGQPWQAKIDGDAFLLAPRGEWNGSVERSTAIRYVDWNGQRQLRTVAQLQR